MEPADYFAQAERPKLFESTLDGGDAAEPLSIGQLNRSMVGDGRGRNECFTVLVHPHGHLPVPTQRLLPFAHCLFVSVCNTDSPKHVHLGDLTIDRVGWHTRFRAKRAVALETFREFRD